MKSIVGSIFIILAIIVQIHLRVTNIDMTEIRLLVSYPLVHLLCVIWIVAGYILMSEGRK